MNDENDILELMQSRSSVRKYVRDKDISQSHQDRIVQSAQMSSSSYNLQTYSIIAVRDETLRREVARLSGEQWFICDASLFWIFCVDLYKMKYVTDQAGYDYYQSKFLESTLMATIDTALAAQTAAIEAEALGYGICMIGGVRNHVDQLVSILELPKKVFPLVGLCIGYPESRNPAKPRLPVAGIMMTDRYDRASVESAIDSYDEDMHLSGIYDGRTFPADEVKIVRPPSKDRYGWVQHSGRRASTRNEEKARQKLRSILLGQDLGLD